MKTYRCLTLQAHFELEPVTITLFNSKVCNQDQLQISAIVQ